MTPRKVALLTLMVAAMAVGIRNQLPLDGDIRHRCPVGTDARTYCILQQVYGRAALIVTAYVYVAAGVGWILIYTIPNRVARRRREEEKAADEWKYWRPPRRR
jgi:hypothetical protein